ncbi:MAG: hypothetical protein A2896_01545 [Candidatus Nealsonbacteria bacterium RIFCSPLOWO2_01_FULL_43_32]|uniref:Uncharacterized protein n=1 Tax=Candidatus Nealsonbacteria bacterium RIFCSPLOWO2_01_FULL_43_32 TaxID=1801672 RepID=A0A1G2EDX1_9BACT|nr:MAG: hypothetical protein A2896_01545 [Candidatus Nealsonbacteria bacterium RIFCSPLOWO2_01_FULL_43_32]
MFSAEENKISKFSVIKELCGFLMIRKKWWLIPLAVLLIIFGALIVFVEGSALAPFIYTIF